MIESPVEWYLALFRIEYEWGGGYLLSFLYHSGLAKEFVFKIKLLSIL